MVLLDSIISSILRVAAGATLSFLAAMSIALGIFHFVNRFSRPAMLTSLLVALTPPPVWVSISMRAAGIGYAMHVLTIVCSTFFILLAVDLYLCCQIPHRRLHIASLYSLSLYKRVRFVFLPELQAGLLVGARLTSIIGWVAVTTAEAIGTRSGLGALVNFGRSMYSWPIIFSGWAAILGCALLFDGIIVFVCREKVEPRESFSDLECHAD
jgi:ABC-type nitrate/sulfonate/bicarbonate transport system permease component